MKTVSGRERPLASKEEGTREKRKVKKPNNSERKITAIFAASAGGGNIEVAKKGREYGRGGKERRRVKSEMKKLERKRGLWLTNLLVYTKIVGE